MKGRLATLAVVLTAAPMVALYEGVVLNKYADPVGIPTVCAGETNQEILSLRDAFSRDECIALMGASLYEHAMKIEPCIHRPVTRNQAAALVSFSYNVGPAAFCGSTLARKLNAGMEFCSELSRWVYAKGVKLPGLVKRRAAERAMCEAP